MMNRQNTLDIVSLLIAIGSFLAVFQTFIFGKHFVIPTMCLLLAIILGNFAWFGLKQHRWAKYMNFYVYLLLGCHTFFALFWAGPAKPGQFFGEAFYPLYGSVCVVTLLLSFFYFKDNQLYSKTVE